MTINATSHYPQWRSRLTDLVNTTPQWHALIYTRFTGTHSSHFWGIKLSWFKRQIEKEILTNSLCIFQLFSSQSCLQQCACRLKSLSLKPLMPHSTQKKNKELLCLKNHQINYFSMLDTTYIGNSIAHLIACILHNL